MPSSDEDESSKGGKRKCSRPDNAKRAAEGQILKSIFNLVDAAILTNSAVKDTVESHTGDSTTVKNHKQNLKRSVHLIATGINTYGKHIEEYADTSAFFAEHPEKVLAAAQKERRYNCFCVFFSTLIIYHVLFCSTFTTQHQTLLNELGETLDSDPFFQSNPKLKTAVQDMYRVSRNTEYIDEVAAKFIPAVNNALKLRKMDCVEQQVKLKLSLIETEAQNRIDAKKAEADAAARASRAKLGGGSMQLSQSQSQNFDDEENY